MASNRDLLEADAYNRRRLVIAFVRGAAGDGNPQSASPGRAILAGVLLSVLIIVGSTLATAIGQGDLAWRS